MTIRTEYRYKELTPINRYVRKHICQDWYEWCEQSAEDLRFNCAAGTCDAEDLPDDVREICDNTPPNGFYACVWPLGEGCP